ncbi:hypothetical protein [Streptomyces nigrescens]|uniref:hypothetical protein n=1 Tax=Streptomyces nigrescens TaxID=1920 RepID=UPI0036F9F264
MLEPQDLQDFTSSGAMHSVLVEVQHDHIVPGPTGLFTAMRHISLISELINRFSGDAQHLSEQSVDDTVRALTAACLPLATAQVHYAYALDALVSLQASKEGTAERIMPTALDDLEIEQDLYRHLEQAVKALDDARVALYRSHRDTPPSPRPTAAPVHAARLSAHRKR